MESLNLQSLRVPFMVLADDGKVNDDDEFKCIPYYEMTHIKFDRFKTFFDDKIVPTQKGNEKEIEKDDKEKIYAYRMQGTNGNCKQEMPTD